MDHGWMLVMAALIAGCGGSPTVHPDAAEVDAADVDAADVDAANVPPPTCDAVDGSQHPAIVGLANNLGGGQPLATAMANNNVPGLSIAIRDTDGIIYTAVFGVANNQAFDAAAPPLSPSTLFQAASIGKGVTALAYLVSPLSATTLNTDIAATLVGTIATPYAITPAQLMTHSAGTGPHAFVEVYADTDPMPSATQLVNGTSPSKSTAVTFDSLKVGTFDYSGGGYTLWQAWLEAASSQSVGEFVHDQLFVPAGASRSSFTQPLTPAIDHDATCGRSPYLTNNSRCRVPNPPLVAAGLWTTPAELACMTELVTTHHAGVLATVKSRSLLTDFDGGTYPQKMGIGLFHRAANGIDETAGHFYEHSGVNEGFRSQWVFFDDGRLIVAMDNGYANNGGISGFAVRALCRELGWSCTANNVGP